LLGYSGDRQIRRTDFAAIESELEVIQKQLSRLPARRQLGRTALGIMFATMVFRWETPMSEAKIDEVPCIFPASREFR